LAANEVTSLDVLTMGVAIVGAVTGIVALVVQSIQFRSSGPRLKVDLLWAWIGPGGSGAITVPMTGKRPTPPEQGYDTLMLAVQARNTGRAATTVETAGIRRSDGMRFHHPTAPVGPSTPVRLEAESSVMFFVDPQPMLVAAEVIPATGGIAAYVMLGSGREVRSGEVLKVS
jgi:hypothetical protein